MRYSPTVIRKIIKTTLHYREASGVIYREGALDRIMQSFDSVLLCNDEQLLRWAEMHLWREEEENLERRDGHA